MDTVKKILTGGWKFHYGECEEAWYKGFDDSSWEVVTVPHDFAVTAPFSEEYSSGTGYLRGGIAWYRLSVKIPEEYKGKRISLVFDGIYKNSYVWVNSYFMGKRPYGYSEIVYDISDRASFGDEPTVICVKVVHTDISDSRWFTGSGITRKVSLVVSEKIAPVMHGLSFNTVIIGSSGDKSVAEVNVSQKIFTSVGVEDKVHVRCVFYDDKGMQVLSMEKELEKNEGGVSDVRFWGTIEYPKLWSVDEPNLYTLDTFIKIGMEEYLADSQKVGIRTISFDPDKGFSLNGINMKLKGVCVHHDGGCLGAAMKKEVWRRRLELLKKAGCNAIRCSHNPHMPELYELCDELGFLVIDEAFDEWENPKNKWHQGHNVYPPKHQGYYEDFPTWHEEDLRTMIRRDKNHPSVIMYSIGNEIDYPNDPYCHPIFTKMTGNNDNNKPAKEMEYDVNKPNMERLVAIARELADIVRDEDPTKPVTAAAAFPELSSKLGFNDVMDVVGYNYKEHLYAADHKRFPGKPFVGSENSHSLEAWNAVKDNDFICGQFLWTGIDYLGEAHGWPIHGSGAGFITTAGFPKEEFNERAQLWGGSGVPGTATAEDAGTNGAMAGAAPVMTLWKPEGANAGGDAEDPSDIGYLYQLLITGGGETEYRVEVSGAGELAGIDNGDLADNISFTSDSRKCFEGNLAIYVRRLDAGDIKVKVVNAQTGAGAFGDDEIILH
ncbi:MAG: glycoside hydrolase family 2 [Butyrivibrio sp.]|nr:glycoside hydrolase family 2 [Butyrivibrio sp.]